MKNIKRYVHIPADILIQCTLIQTLLTAHSAYSSLQAFTLSGKSIANRV